MIRNALGSLMGLVGATAAVWSPFRAWYDGRQGRDYRLEELFSAGGVTTGAANPAASVLLPFLVAAVLTLLAVVRRSRFLMAFAGVIVLGVTVLWMVRQGQAAGSLSVGGSGTGLGVGVANAFGAGALMILGAFVMTGRGRRSRVPRSERVPFAPVAPPVPPGGGWPDEASPDTRTMVRPGHGPVLGAPIDGPTPEDPPPPPHGPPLGPPLNP